MATFVDPTIADIPSPVNLDFWVEQLKNHLEVVPWLEKSYGKAYREAEQVDGQAYWFPCVYDSNSKYLRLDFNKNLRSLSFIFPRDPGQTQEYRAITNSTAMRRELDLIVLYDLALIASEVPGYNYTYRFEEILLADLMQALRLFPVVEVQQVYQEAENVWERFSVPHVEWQTFMYPRGGFRLRMVLAYDEDCYANGNSYPPLIITPGLTLGDMLKSVYDPTGIEGDAFDYDNFYNTPYIPQDVSDLTDIIGLLFSGDYDDLVNKPTIPDVKRVSLTVVDGATPAVDCQSGTEVYATWEAATAATAPVLSNMVANSVIHFAVKKTTVDDVVITFAATGYQFALEGEVAAASKDVTLDGDLDSFSSIMLTVTSHQVSGDTVITIAAK